MDAGPYKITCQEYPPEFYIDKNIAKAYFKQFGKLKRLQFRPALRTCTVEYANQEGYLKALNNAGEYRDRTFVVLGHPSEQKSNPAMKANAKKDPVWVDRDEIEAELEAMSGIAPKEFKSLEAAFGPLPEAKLDPKPKLNRTWKKDATNTLKKGVKQQKQNLNSKISEEEVELINLVLSQALTNEDKFKILDARDKLIKINLKKFPTAKSGPTIGTCPDMCPEKERFFREIKHQVAWYEQDDNNKTMNYNKAIKQYSRSSADQEAPLSHELRPVNVLQMTMGYLLHNIIDLCDTDEVHIGEWYHFLWDRTRGIRKDITQQESCSQGAVELVEQCARFHIHCSARLVAEDPAVFDHKINTENLTKCLQTLKYMYHDLQLKGQSCENEAEFRAYIILLNLNDGNFMWEVQQLRPEIKKSKEVMFALQVHSAIDKNNYVQFFKLVNSTTYLNACILMRYFIQVRIMAVKTLLKCYIPRASKTAYPLAELQSILAFDDFELTVDFLQYYGLSVNDSGTHIILEKNGFFSPEFPYVLDRSNVVEDKRECSVGRIVCGKDLPPKTYLSHTVQTSFDEKGYLINKDILDEMDLERVKLKLLEELDESKTESDSEMKEEKTAKFSFGLSEDKSAFHAEKEKYPFGFQPKEKPDVIYKEKDNDNQFVFAQKEKSEPFSFADKAPKTSSIFAPQTKQSESIFKIQKTPPSTNIFSSQFQPTPVDQTDFVSKPTNIFQTFPEPTIEPPKPGGFAFHLNEPPVKPLPTPNLPSIDELQREEEEEKRRVEEETRRLVELEKREELKRREEKEKLEAKLSEERKLREQEEEKLRRINEMKETERLKEKERLRDKEIKDSVKKVLNNLVGEVDEMIRFEKLEAIKARVQKRLLLRMVGMWKNRILKNKRKRKAVDCGPMWFSKKSLQQSAEELHIDSQNLTLNLMKRYKYGRALNIEQLSDELIEKINIHQLTYGILKNRMFELTVNKPKNIFWKVLISIPDKSELATGLNRIEEILDKAFPWKKIDGQSLHLEYTKPSALESVTYCVEKQQGYDKIRHYDSNGIIFVAKNFNGALQRRIFENLRHLGVHTRIPIVLVLQEFDQKDCRLEELIKENIVSDYIVYVENSSPGNFLSAIEQGLVFLSKRIQRPPPLELDTLKSFASKHLCSEMWKRANSFAKWNSNYKKCLQNPNVVIGLYNDGLSRIKAIILDENNAEFPVFPEEFKKYLNSEIPDFLPCSYCYFPAFWRSADYARKLERLLSGLNLPAWSLAWPPKDECELEMSVLKYCSQITEEPERLFYKTMSLFLRHVDPKVNFEDIERVLWSDVVQLWGTEKLARDFTLENEFKYRTIFKEYFVVYNINSLEEYRSCDWFYVYNPRIKKMVEEELEKEQEKTTRRTLAEEFHVDDDFLDSIRANLLSNKPDKSQMIRELDRMKESLEDLNAAMKVHKRISSKLDECLSRAIAEK
ncbi:unnamed protein product [Phyllotreta striolata]|uniref:Germinal-center associated nuclear protein n=1 Tax=Phyllotreta striolata TaxID=444603 RepID=A0A9N9TE14_PHYSR|nr:unnamed protein product [Phyllotreta striolata]